MSKGSQPAGQTTTTQAPAPYMYPYIGTALNQAGNLLTSGGPQYYPGNQVAGFSQPQEQAFGNISSMANNLYGANQAENQAAYTNPMMTAGLTGGQQALAQMGQGSMNNPELQRMLDLQNQSIQSTIGSQFAGSGRNLEGSIPLQAQTMGNADSSLLSNAYNINQGNALAANSTLGQQQLAAMSMAPNLFNTQLGAQSALGGVGGQVQNLAQQMIGANQNAYNYQQQLPYQQLGQFENFLGGVQPGMQQSSPYFTNPTANALGMGMAGLGLYNGANAAMGSKGAKGAGSAADAAPAMLA